MHDNLRAGRLGRAAVYFLGFYGAVHAALGKLIF
jgi:hypothetical protein